MRLQHMPQIAAKVLRRLPSAVKELPQWRITVSGNDRAALAAQYAPDVAYCEYILDRPLPWLKNTN